MNNNTARKLTLVPSPQIDTALPDDMRISCAPESVTLEHSSEAAEQIEKISKLASSTNEAAVDEVDIPVEWDLEGYHENSSELEEVSIPKPVQNEEASAPRLPNKYPLTGNYSVDAANEEVTNIDAEAYRKATKGKRNGIRQNLKLYARKAWNGLKTFINPMKAFNKYADEREEIELRGAQPELYNTGDPVIDSTNRYVQQIDNDLYTDRAQRRQRGRVKGLNLYLRRAWNGLRSWVNPLKHANRYADNIEKQEAEVTTPYTPSSPDQEAREMPSVTAEAATEILEEVNVPSMPEAPELLSPSDKYAQKLVELRAEKAVLEVEVEKHRLALQNVHLKENAAKKKFTALSTLHSFYKDCRKEGVEIKYIDENNLPGQQAKLRNRNLAAKLPEMLVTRRKLEADFKAATDTLDELKLKYPGRAESTKSMTKAFSALRSFNYKCNQEGYNLDEPLETPVSSTPVQEEKPAPLATVHPLPTFWTKTSRNLAAAAAIFTALFGFNSNTKGHEAATEHSNATSPSHLVAKHAPMRKVVDIAADELEETVENVAPKQVEPTPTPATKTVKKAPVEINYETRAERMIVVRNIFVLRAKIGRKAKSQLPQGVRASAVQMLDDAITYLKAADTSCGKNGKHGVCPLDKGRTPSQVVTEAYIRPTEDLLKANGIIL